MFHYQILKIDDHFSLFQNTVCQILNKLLLSFAMIESDKSFDAIFTDRPEFNCRDHYEVKENDVHQSPCKPEGEPEPSMTWLKDGKEVSFPEGLTRQDSGQYSLRARNKHGEAYHNLSVDVLCKF